jgi:hypothetical protein
MRQKKSLFTLPVLLVIFMAFILCLTGITEVFGEVGRTTDNKPVADEMIGSSGITWMPKVNYGQLELRIARPDGTIFQKTFDSGVTPYAALSSICEGRFNDGSYTYELRVIPLTDKKVRKTGAFAAESGVESREQGRKTLTQTGYFQVQGGMIVTPSASEDISRPMDIVHADDVIIDGSLCVGNDCYSGLAFGFDTIVMMENNLRIFFDDTSTIQNYPRNDWRIICNDSTDGGGNYFAVQDATEVSNIFVLEAGAPDNSLYVDSHGDVGINTSTPYYELHIVDGDSPCVRLDQDGSYGWEPQKWDLCGNESNFFIRDATHASKLPFRIEPDASTNSIFVKSNGNVGIGTGAPSEALEVERTGTNPKIILERVSGAKAVFAAASTQTHIGSMTNHEFRLYVNNNWVMRLNTDGSLDMSDGGGYDGTWNPASSREYKENIRDLTTEEAVTSLEGLNPVKFNYKKHKEEEKLGFIAEEVPDLVATNGRKNLSTMDIVAVLTKVVQEQQKALKEQQNTIAQLKEKVAELEKK